MPPDSPNSPYTILRCVSCSAPVRAEQGACAHCGTRIVLTAQNSIAAPVAPLSEPPAPTSIPDDALCRGCGYPLTGLKVSDVCPECSRPVLDSIRGDALAYCDPGYLKSLHRGVVLVQAGIISILIVVLLIIPINAVMGKSVATEILRGIISMIPSILSLVGWYALSTPDPGVGLHDKGDKPRKLVRFTAILNAGAALFAGIIGVIAPSAANLTTQPVGQLSFADVLNGFGGVAHLISLIAFIIQFFASMKYLTWLAPRIPDYALVSSMKKRTWIIALLFFPGVLILCFPALISVIMFYRLLDKFRLHFKLIRMKVSGTDVLWDDVFPTALTAPTSKTH